VCNSVAVTVYKYNLIGEKVSGYGMGGIPFTYRDMQVENNGGY